MSAKAIKYAEDMGVHDTFDETVELVNEVDKLYGDLDKAQDRRRQLEEDYSDREWALASEKRSEYHDMPETRFKTELKGWERSDEKLREIRDSIIATKGEIQGLEYDADILKLRIRVGTARLEELGGYFNYLAAVKNQADKTTKPQENKE